ncbi:hypothetical protein [Pseudomonas chlororaphis]|uniref:hypothetical protein n=1 Tax=Pseudomonas chlororaphis TaxID=587753 RepID=UPI00117B2B72
MNALAGAGMNASSRGQSIRRPAGNFFKLSFALHFPILRGVKSLTIEDKKMATSGKNPLMGNKDTQKPSPAGKKSGGQGSGGSIPADRQKAPGAGKKGGAQGAGGGTRKA